MFPVTNAVELGAALALYFAMYAVVCAVARLVTIEDLKGLISTKSV